MRPLLAVDAATLYFRAFFAVPTSVRSPGGRPVNAVRGYLDMNATLIERFRPSAYAACWDADWRPAWRVAAVPSYKTHRVAAPGTGPDTGEEVPDELAAQVPVLVEGLGLLGLAGVGAPGHEADDVAATLSQRWPAETGGQVVVASGDKDLFQLVDDMRGVTVAYVGRGIAKLEVVDGAVLQRRFGVPDGPRYRDFAVLVGDRSDGLPGVAGVGAGTAADLLLRFGDLPSLMAAAADPDSALSPSWRRKLEAAGDYVTRARLVVTGVRDAPLVAEPLIPGRPGPEDLPGLLGLPATVDDPDALSAWADEWGVRSSVNRMLRALASVTAAPAPTGGSTDGRDDDPAPDG